MEDILDFLKTPAGQGLLSGAFGYAANAKKGTPWNNFGRGGMTGLLGYNTAIDQTGFVPPVPLDKALAQTVRHEFIEKHDDEPLYFTE